MVAGDVTTVYVDDEGNVISTPDVQSGVGKLGLPYTTTAKTIPNFTLVSTPLNAKRCIHIGTSDCNLCLQKK